MKRLRISEPSRFNWSRMGVMALLLGAVSLVIWTSWLSFAFMVDPRSAIWMNQFLPKQARIPLNAWEDPKTLADIKAELGKIQLIVGEPLSVPRPGRRSPDLLLPIFRTPKVCTQETGCEPVPTDRVVEIRAYRPVSSASLGRSQTFQLLSQLDVGELDAAFVTHPLTQARIAEPAPDRALPFSQLELFSDRVSPGTWLLLHGKLQQGDTSIAYGQIVYYDPKLTRLRALIPWTSPKGELPFWHKNLGKGRPVELVINQTVGLEPDFRVYQLGLSAERSAKLQPVSLTQPAIGDGGFKDALFLARSGLWSTALDILESVKRRHNTDWPALAQAQMDLVARHSEVTTEQAAQLSANPAQQTLTYLIDGRWEKAWQVLQAPETDRGEILALLKTDAGQISNRIEAALYLNPQRSAIQDWESLRRLAKSGPEAAIGWLNQQPKTNAKHRAQVAKLLHQIESAESERSPSQPEVSVPLPSMELTSPLAAPVPPSTTDRDPTDRTLGQTKSPSPLQAQPKTQLNPPNKSSRPPQNPAPPKLSPPAAPVN